MDPERLQYEVLYGHEWIQGGIGILEYHLKLAPLCPQRSVG
jgi:hypothetical protein